MALDWRIVDEGWERKAVDFATLSEPGNCREYVALHYRLAVAPATGCSMSRVCEELPLRARIAVVGYLAREPGGSP